MPKKIPTTKPQPAVSKLSVSRREAAAMLSIDIQTIDARIASGALKASKIGTRVLIRVASLEALLDASALC
jgi:excisionase family DNA binding protein